MTDEKYLDLIPKQLCKREITDGIVTLLYFKKPTFVEKIFFRKMLNKPYKIDLDEVGSFIWEQIDSSKNIKEIVEVAKKHFGRKIEPADERIILFMKQMHSTKLIILFEKQVN